MHSSPKPPNLNDEPVRPSAEDDTARRGEAAAGPGAALDLLLLGEEPDPEADHRAGGVEALRLPHHHHHPLQLHRPGCVLPLPHGRHG